MTAAQRLGTALLLALGWLAISPATGWAGAESASLGHVSATLTDQIRVKPGSPYEEKVLSATLNITRAGQVAYSGPVTSSLPYCKVEYPGQCWPQGARIESPEFAVMYPSLQVLELASTGEPAVVVHLYSGGAHCCHVDQVFSWNPATATYEAAERLWGSFVPRISDLSHNGQLEFVTGDNRFEYQFASFAFSGFPLQIFAVRGGTFVDVTRSYPAQLADDARSKYRHYFALADPGTWSRLSRCVGCGRVPSW
jgi:hypothetical protein